MLVYDFAWRYLVAEAEAEAAETSEVAATFQEAVAILGAAVVAVPQCARAVLEVATTAPAPAGEDTIVRVAATEAALHFVVVPSAAAHEAVRPAAVVEADTTDRHCVTTILRLRGILATNHRHHRATRDVVRHLPAIAMTVDRRRLATIGWIRCLPPAGRLLLAETIEVRRVAVSRPTGTDHPARHRAAAGRPLPGQAVPRRLATGTCLLRLEVGYRLPLIGIDPLCR